MRTLISIILIAAVCIASATFKDPRAFTHPVAPLSQEEVARQQALQKQIGQVGGVPQIADPSGYAPDAESDHKANGIVAAQADTVTGSNSPSQVILSNEDTMKSEQQKPKKMALGALWAILAGMILAAGAWAGMHKYGPKPPAHLAR